MSQARRKRGRPRAKGWPELVEAWCRYDAGASAPAVQRLLAEFGFVVPESTVRSRMRRPAREQVPGTARPSRRTAASINASNAARTLIDRGVSVSDAHAVLAMADLAPILESQWEKIGAATKGKRGGAARVIERLRREHDPELTRLAQRVVERADALRKGRARSQDDPPLTRPLAIADPSQPCATACEGIDAPHRHCVVCDRTWAENTSGAGPLSAPVTSSHATGVGRALLLRRYAIHRAASVVWTTTPKTGDRFVFACHLCRRRALQQLPASPDRDGLLAVTPDLADPRSHDVAADSPIERAMRRTPRLWAWSLARNELDDGTRVLSPVLPEAKLVLDDGRNVVFGAAVHIVFAGYADLGDFVRSLVAAQGLMHGALAQYFAEETVSRAGPAPEEQSQKPLSLRLPGVPSLSLVSFDLAILVRAVDGTEPWPKPEGDRAE